jgi:hypothetical protein
VSSRASSSRDWSRRVRCAPRRRGADESAGAHGLHSHDLTVVIAKLTKIAKAAKRACQSATSIEGAFAVFVVFALLAIARQSWSVKGAQKAHDPRGFGDGHAA